MGRGLGFYLRRIRFLEPSGTPDSPAGFTGKVFLTRMSRLFLSDEVLPIEVQEFHLECIDSVAQLEALLLLHGSPQQDWDILTLARRLHVEEQKRPRS